MLPLLAGITGAAALDPHEFADGFRNAMVIAGLTCAAGGVIAAATIRNPKNVPKLFNRHHRRYHCALDATPLDADGAAGTAATTL